jgi:hypothetical protein
MMGKRGVDKKSRDLAAFLILAMAEHCLALQQFQDFRQFVANRYRIDF